KPISVSYSEIGRNSFPFKRSISMMWTGEVAGCVALHCNTARQLPLRGGPAQSRAVSNITRRRCKSGNGGGQDMERATVAAVADGRPTRPSTAPAVPRCRTNSRRGLTDLSRPSYPPVEAACRVLDVLRAVNDLRIAKV